MVWLLCLSMILFRKPVPTFRDHALIIQRCPGNAEYNKKPCHHGAAGGNQRMMDARPSATNAVAPEHDGAPHDRNRAEDAEPRQGIEYTHEGIERRVVNGAGHREEH